MQLRTKGICHLVVTFALICFWTGKLQAQAPDFLWAKQAVGPSAGQAIAKDAAGNVFVVGRFYNSAVFGSTTLTNANNWDVFVAKYDASGSLIWIRGAGGADEEFASGRPTVTGFISLKQ